MPRPMGKAGGPRVAGVLLFLYALGALALCSDFALELGLIVRVQHAG